MIARPLAIANVPLDTNLLLAPIAGYCDLAYRLICREQGGVGLACTDLLSPHGLLRGTARSLDLAATNAADHPLGMQLYGGDPQIMAEGARWAADHGAAIVDINMGCPVDKVTKKDGGSRLMVPDQGPAPGPCRSFTLALRITDAVRAALPPHIPLTAKMRLGWSCPHDAPRLARDLLDAGVAAITVHGRTTEQRFKGAACREGIRRVVDAVRDKSAHWPAGPIPVIANGDVDGPDACLAMLRDTAADGVMIGRAAISRPWIFRDCWQAQLADAPQSPHRPPPILPPPPAPEQIAAIIRRYFQLMRTFRGDPHAMTQIRQRISRMAAPLVQGEIRSVKPLKERIRTAQTPADVHAALDDFCAGGLRLLRQPGATAAA